MAPDEAKAKKAKKAKPDDVKAKTAQPDEAKAKKIKPDGAKAEQAKPDDAEAKKEKQGGKSSSGKAAKKRRKAAEKAAAAAAAENGSKPKEQPSVDEDKRKNAQREIQQLVVRLRKEGKSEAEIAAAKRELKGSFGSLHQPDSKRRQKAEAWQEYFKTDDAKEERKEGLETKHDMVIIPVFWRGRHDKLDVLKAVEDVKACVAQQGIDAWVDSRRQYTPGQKFAHWEFRGVMLRVEVGPEDLANGVCRVCKAKEAGDYKSVQKKRVRLPPAGTRALLLALKEFGMDSIDIERREGDSDDEEPEDGDQEVVGLTKKGVKRKGPEEAEPATEVGADDLEGNWTPRMDPTAAKAKKKGNKK